MDTKRILAVDDDPVALIYIEEVLKAEGYRVSTATSGEDAIRQVRADLPDLVLLDVQMPGMGGYEVLSFLRQQKRTAQLPVVFLTVRDAPQDEARGLSEHAVDYISKDVLTPDRVAILLYRIRNFFAWQENERLRGMLATIVSANHEINNPLMVIMGSAEMLRMKHLPETAPEAARESVARIVDACKRAKDVMEQIASMGTWNVKSYSKDVEMLDLTAGDDTLSVAGDRSVQGVDA